METTTALVCEPNINEIRHRVKDLYAEFWTDTELWDFWEKNGKDEHGVMAECIEDLAANPEKAKKWNRKVRYTHYDLLEMATNQRLLQSYAAAKL